MGQLAYTPDAQKYIYTHYPPGPNWLVGIWMKMAGPSPVARLRLFPIVFGWLAIVVFGVTLARRFGLLFAILMLTWCDLLPLFSNMMHGLHYQGYALSLLLLTIAECLRQKPRLWIIALLGFAQGWLSFDFIFLATLAPLAIEPLSASLERRGPAYTRRWKELLAGCVGFGSAMALHIVQVTTYRGSFVTAIADLGQSAATRSGESGAGILEKLRVAGELIWNYAVHLSADPRFFGWNLAAGIVVMAVTLVILGFAANMRNPESRERNPFVTLTTRFLIPILPAFFISVLWLVVMRQHALIHTHFLPRHLFLLGFVATALFLHNASADLRRLRRIQHG
jgi:hypothetical protein